MKRISRFLILTISLFLTTCAPSPLSTSDITITLPVKCQLEPSQSVTVALDGNMPSDATIEWAVDRGSISRLENNMAKFTAPDQPGPVSISVRVTANGETVSKTETCTIDFHSTNTPQLGINTETSQSDPVQTPEIQIDIIDEPSYDFKNGCISEFWREWPANQASIQNSPVSTCEDFSNNGLIATSEGLKIFVKEPKDEVMFGLTTKIPEKNTHIAIQLRINELSTNRLEEATELYLGLIDSTLNTLNGKILIFRAYQLDYQPALIYREFTESGQVKHISSTIDISKDISIIIEKDPLSFSLIITGISGKSIEITDIPYDSKWDSLIIGYKIPAGSTFSGMIKDVQVSTEN